MNDSVSEMAPEVESILAAARDRPGGDDRVSVDPRPFEAALDAAEADGRVPIVAEVKPTSPTTEGTRTDDPADLAAAMVDGGAAAISVLTEPAHFGGSIGNLERVRAAVDVPVLRKDFVVRADQLDLVESDLVLLIARFVEDDLEPLLQAAESRGFQALVEVHTAAELDAAIDAGASIIGVNNRDLTTLSVDLGTFEAVAPEVPDDATLIAESGVSTPADVRRMRAAGADALLVGTAIMDGDPRANVRELTTAETGHDTS
ncbi:indole-3-glycerol phosphate synthase [Haloferacaceae archaeon DSL9]